MQAPVLVFDHINDTTVVLVGANAEKQMDEIAAAASSSSGDGGSSK